MLPLKWTHNKACFEDLSFTYNLTALAPTPKCSKTVITNETEAVIDGLCSGTEYEITIFGVSGDVKTKPVRETLLTLESTQLFTSHNESYHGDLITLICSYHDITEEVNKTLIFNLRNPFWRMNDIILHNHSYHTLFHNPQVSSIQIVANTDSSEVNVNFSCFTFLNDGWMEESNIVTVQFVEDLLPSRPGKSLRKVIGTLYTVIGIESFLFVLMIVILFGLTLYIIKTKHAKKNVSSGSSDTFKSEEEGEIVPNLNEGVTEQQNPAYVPLEECRILRAPEGSSQSPQYVNDNM